MADGRTFEIIYFPGRGRAEASRLILAAAGVEFKDTRIAGDDWAKLKAETRFGKMPLLRVTKDGKTTTLGDSFAISTYLGETLGLAAETPELRAAASGALLALKDTNANLIKARFGPEEGRADAIKAFLGTDLPDYAARLDAEIASRGGPFLLGAKHVWQDIAIADYYSGTLAAVPGASDIVKKYENITRLTEAVNAIPAVAEWIKNRPETPF